MSVCLQVDGVYFLGPDDDLNFHANVFGAPARLRTEVPLGTGYLLFGRRVPSDTKCLRAQGTFGYEALPGAGYLWVHNASGHNALSGTGCLRTQAFVGKHRRRRRFTHRHNECLNPFARCGKMKSVAFRSHGISGN